MKKYTIILTVLIALTIRTNGQITNSGFENWTTVGSYEETTGWFSFNFASTGSFYPCTKSTDHYPASVGSYSVRIENNTALIGNYSGLGVLFLGDQVGGSGPFPIIGHPTSLTGYFKFFPLNGDTMYIRITLYSNNSPVSNGLYTTTTSASNWTSFHIPLSTYTSADSGIITIAAYYANNPPPQCIPRGNSVLYVDNLNFDNLITGTSEHVTKNTTFKLYPNPASDIVTLNIDNISNADLTLNIYNVIGTLVKSEIVRQNQQQINVGALGNGIYMVEIKYNERTEMQKLIVEK